MTFYNVLEQTDAHATKRAYMLFEEDICKGINTTLNYTDPFLLLLICIILWVIMTRINPIVFNFTSQEVLWKGTSCSAKLAVWKSHKDYNSLLGQSLPMVFFFFQSSGKGEIYDTNCIRTVFHSSKISCRCIQCIGEMGISCHRIAKHNSKWQWPWIC